MGDEKLAKGPVLIFANKQDLDTAMDADQIKDFLKLQEIKDREWKIQACSAKTKEGLKEGIDWLTQ